MTTLSSRTRRTTGWRTRAVAVAGTAGLALVAGLGAAAADTTTPSPAASAPVASASAATTGAPVTFTVGILDDVDSLNPFTGIVATDYEVWQAMYDTLSTYSAKDFSPSRRWPARPRSRPTARPGRTPSAPG